MNLFEANNAALNIIEKSNLPLRQALELLDYSSMTLSMKSRICKIYDLSKREIDKFLKIVDTEKTLSRELGTVPQNVFEFVDRLLEMWNMQLGLNSLFFSKDDQTSYTIDTVLRKIERKTIEMNLHYSSNQLRLALKDWQDRELTKVSYQENVKFTTLVHSFLLEREYNKRTVPGEELFEEFKQYERIKCPTSNYSQTRFGKELKLFMPEFNGYHIKRTIRHSNRYYIFTKLGED